MKTATPTGCSRVRGSGNAVRAMLRACPGICVWMACTALGLSAPPAPGSHPLDPAIELAEKGLKRIKEEVRDYTAVLVKRERIGNKLGEHQYMFIKVRHEIRKNGKVVVPFSVYLRFLKPESLKGREVIYIRGRNDDKLIAHEPVGSVTGTLVGTVRLDPKGMIAMRGNRYPITEIGIKNLIEKLLRVAKADRQYGECDVHFYKNAKVNNRSCTKMEVVHPKRRPYFRFHIARIFIDEALQIPVRYESYDWPEKKGGTPLLLEEYTYLNVKLNVGLTDRDFDPKNPDYEFP